MDSSEKIMLEEYSLNEFHKMNKEIGEEVTSLLYELKTKRVHEVDFLELKIANIYCNFKSIKLFVTLKPQYSETDMISYFSFFNRMYNSMITQIIEAKKDNGAVEMIDSEDFIEQGKDIQRGLEIRLSRMKY